MLILDSTGQLLYDKYREAELMDILGIQSMDEVAIIPWRPPTIPPDEASYVFLKYRDPKVPTVISFDFFLMSTESIPIITASETPSTYPFRTY